MDLKESSIFFDKKNEMYKIELGFYTRYFDYIIYSNNGILREFGKENIKVFDFKNDTNLIFGFTKSFGKILFNIFNLDDLKNIYRVVNDTNLFSFNIKSVNYYLLIFLDLENNIGYYTNFKNKDFEIIIENNLFIIKNKVFDSIIFKKEFSFLNIESYNFSDIIENSILDFYFCQNLFFSKNIFDNIFKDFNILFLNSNIVFEDNFGVKSFLLKTRNLKDIKELKKIILTFNPKQFVYYPIYNQQIKDLFVDIEDISNIKLENLNLNFKIPKNIFEYDDNFLKFQKDILKLQYVLYSLKISYKNILNQNDKNINEYTNLAFIRLNLTKENLEKNIIFYEKIYNELYEKITKI